MERETQIATSASASIFHPYIRAGLLQSFSMANGLAVDAKEFNAATRCGLIMNIQTFPIKANKLITVTPAACRYKWYNPLSDLDYNLNMSKLKKSISKPISGSTL